MRPAPLLLKKLRVLLLLTLLRSAEPAFAQVVLNFDDLSLVDYAPIPASYGAALDSNLADIHYRTFDPNTDVTLNNFVEFWNANYGDLSKVVYPEENGYAAEIALVPASGYGVKIVSFDLAGYSRTDLAASVLRIVDGSGSVLVDFVSLAQNIAQGASDGTAHTTYTLNLSVPGTAKIQWGTNWNIGLDNLVFETVTLASIPEPSTVALLACGLALVVARAGARRRAAAKD